MVAPRAVRTGRPAGVLAGLVVLSPALVAATRGVDALLMGCLVFAVLLFAAPLSSLFGTAAGGRARLLLPLLTVAALLTAADLGLRAWAPQLRENLGISLQLVGPGCVILGCLPPGEATFGLGRCVAGAARRGAGIALGLFGVGCLREALGRGTVTLPGVGSFDGVLTLGGLARHPSAVVSRAAGALLILGFLLGLAKWIAERRGKT